MTSVDVSQILPFQTEILGPNDGDGDESMRLLRDLNFFLQFLGSQIPIVAGLLKMQRTMCFLEK